MQHGASSRGPALGIVTTVNTAERAASRREPLKRLRGLRLAPPQFGCPLWTFVVDIHRQLLADGHPQPALVCLISVGKPDTRNMGFADAHGRLFVAVAPFVWRVVILALSARWSVLLCKQVHHLMVGAETVLVG